MSLMTCSFSTANLLSRDKDLGTMREEQQGETQTLTHLTMYQSMGCSLSLSTDSMSISAYRIRRYVIARQYFAFLSPKQGRTLNSRVLGLAAANQT